MEYWTEDHSYYVHYPDHLLLIHLEADTDHRAGFVAAKQTENRQIAIECKQRTQGRTIDPTAERCCPSAADPGCPEL